MRRFFITGTDTDCGKTYVTGQLLDYCAHSLAIKPVASGVGEGASDAAYLQRSACFSLSDLNPWQFTLAVSPHIAARREQVSLQIDTIADFCLQFQAEGIKTLFIEGAGGLMVPLNDRETWVDFLKYTKIPVLLVVGMQLGCINHALLTATALLAHNLDCVGWIANSVDPDMLVLDENIETLQRLLPFPLLATVPFGGTLSPTLSRDGVPIFTFTHDAGEGEGGYCPFPAK